MENTGEGRLAGGEGRRSSCSFETAERTDHCARCDVERSERELRWACVFGSYCYGRFGRQQKRGERGGACAGRLTGARWAGHGG